LSIATYMFYGRIVKIVLNVGVIVRHLFICITH